MKNLLKIGWEKPIKLISLFLLSTFLFSFQIINPYTIHVEGDQVIRYIANSDDHEALNFTNLIEGNEYRLEYYTPPKSLFDKPIVTYSNVEITGTDEISINFIASKNNIFHFGWDDDDSFQEFVVNIIPLSPTFSLANIDKALSPIIVNPAPSVNDLVDSLILGDCFQITNITSCGASGNSAGTFTNGLTSIGIDEGILITTGSVYNAQGPNPSSPCLQSSGNGGSACPDTDLNSMISPFSVYDVTRIEFDFVPTVDTVSFKFVWASDEYCIWSTSNYADVCGFFVSGPGIDGGGAYSNNAINYALAPGGVAINVNSFSHINYWAPDYISNNNANCNNSSACQVLNPTTQLPHPLGTAPAINEVGYNAFSAVYEAKFPTIPDSTYHIKIVVADGSDGAGDSAMFLEANSWDQGEPITVASENPNDPNPQVTGAVVDEACDTLNFNFCRDPEVPIGNDVTVYYTVSSNSTATPGATASTPGADYVVFQTDSIVIPAGSNCITVPVELIQDTDYNEPQETIILEVLDACNTSSSTVTAYINNVGQLLSAIPDTEVCSSGTVTITSSPTGGVEPYSYSWSTGAVSPSITVGPGTYDLVVSDACGQSVSETINVAELAEPTATISGGGSICPNSGASVPIEINFTGPGPWDFTYTRTNGTPVTVTGNTSNPFVIQGDTIASWFIIDLQDPVNGCPATFSGSAIVSEGSLTVNETVSDPLCNGQSSGSITVTPAGGSGSYSYSWSNGGNTSTINGLAAGTYTVTVTDNSSVCEGIETYTLVDPPAISASFSTAPFIDCNNPQGTITATGSGGDASGGYGYNWTTSDGTITSGANAETVTVESAGTYTVQVTDASFCQASFDIVVTGNTSTPTAVAQTPGALDCINTETTLDGTGSSSGPDFTYLWTTSNGNIVSGNTSLNPTVNAAGTYTLAVTDNTNGCESTVDVTVVSDGNLPSISVATPGQIDCNTSSVTINATGSTSGPGIDVLWTTSNGNITSGATTYTPVVDQAGVYTITITDTSNGCISTNDVTIIEDITNPTADVGSQNQIDCNNPSITLGGPGTSSGPSFTYSWTNSSGVVISNSSTVSVNSADTYSFTVTNSSNGCSELQSIVVTENTTVPTAIASGGVNIDCNNSVVTVSGAGSSSGMSYSWTASNGGNIVSGATSIDALVDAQGTYTLTVTDPTNGCSSISSDVIITADTNLPTANAGPSMEITCSSSTVMLDGSGSTSGLNYQWTTTTGNIVSGATTLTPIVDQAGTYVLTVTNNANGCSQTSNVTVTTNANLPTVAISTPADITCTTTSIILDGTASSGGSVYAWTTPDGNIVSGANTLNPTVDAAGTYTLTITDSGSGCSSSNDVTVIADVNLPNVLINSPSDLTCTTSIVTLDGSPSSGGTDFSWTTTNGNIVSGANTANPQVNQPGTYLLTYTNTSSGCSNTATVDVIEDTTLPLAVATSNGNIDCNSTEVSLSGGGSDTPPNFDVLWTTTNGNIIFGETTLSPAVDQAGTYTLTVTSLANGCVSSASVDVTEDLTPPLVSISPSSDLTCVVTEVLLDASSSDQGPGFTYTWSTSNGNIVSGGSSLLATVNSAGTYTLSITSDINGCIGTSDVVVNEDNTVPTASAGPDQAIDCFNSTATLDGSLSTPGLQYQWTTTDGNIVNGANTLNPLVDQGGTYVLQVINSTNGCEATATVNVTESTNQPTASIAVPASIDCNNPTVSLDASSSSSGPTISYSWTTTNGNIVSGANSANPVVDLSGTYTLIVTDNASLCTATADVSVFGNASLPTVVANASGNWDCASTTLLLDGSGSSSGSNFIYNWATTDGNIISDPFSIIATVDTSGTYTLLVQDTTSGCIASTPVTILNLVNYPSITVNDPGPINCSNPEVEITTTISNEGNNPSFNWSTTNGNIVSGANTSSVTVDAAGTYEIIVTNTFNSCESIASIDITENSVYPTALAGPTGELTCTNTDYMLDATGTSTGTNYLYQWSSPDGNIVSGSTTLMPVVDLEGSYILSVTDTTSLCESLDTVVITSNQILPDVEAGASQELNCTTTELNLAGSTTSTGPDYTYAWTTANGNIISGETTLTPLVDASGMYLLSITDLINGCIGTDSVEVTVDANTPNADAGPGMTINCSISSVTLDGTGSSSGADFTYLWTTTDGNIVSGETTTTPEVDAGGTYSIEVTSTVNGCAFISNVNVVTDTIVPTVSASYTGIIDCNTPTLTLSGSGSSTGTSYTYDWTTTDGTIDSGSNTLDPIISAGGTYTLTIVDTVNTCTDNISVTVPEDTVIPIAEAGGDMNITCTNPTVILMGDNSDSGADINYQWTTNTGNIVSGANSLNPEVDGGGVYVLTVSNSVNGCSSIDSTTVLVDANLPTADAGLDLIIDCVNPTAQLDGTGSSSGATIIYVWTTADGNIVSGDSTLTPTIDAGGTYSLQVIDTSNGCEISSSVSVTDDTQLPTATASSSGIVDCNTPTVSISGAGSSTGTEFTYQWTTVDGTIDFGSNTLDPVVSAGGTYTLTILDTLSNCQETVDVIIPEDTTLPLVEAGDTTEITCLVNVVTLDGANSDSGANIEYLWTTATGNIVSGETTNTATADAAGVYLLTVTNTGNGCIAQDSAIVNLDANVPTADAGTALIIDCLNPSIQLDGNASSSGATIEYLWTTTDGNIVSGETTTTPTVDAGGTYSLQVTDTSNGCQISSDVSVTDDTQLPTATASSSGIVDCNTPTISISGAGSSTGTEFTYLWTTTTGTIDSGSNTLDPVVSAGGTYVLTVIDTVSSCEQTTDIIIPEDIAFPTVDAGDTSVITCLIPEVTLDGSNSESGSDISYLWTTVSGNIVSGETTTIATANGAGVYLLTVTNNINGCTSTDSTLVNLDANVPTADAGSDLILDCISPIVQLDGNASSSGTSIEYLWTTVDGNIISGETTTTPTVDAGGTYSLQVTDVSNGCVINSSVFVTDDTQLPTATASAADVVDCSTPSITISGAGSSTGTEYTYQWTTTNGTIDSGSTTLDPVVSAGGLYTLTIIDTISSCQQTTDVTVLEDTVIPLAVAGDSAVITCLIPQVVLDGSSSDSGANIEYLWTTATGNIVSGETTNTATADAAGVYILTVTNQVNGCISQDSAIVNLDANVPTADAGSDLTLDCINPVLQLDGNGSSSGATIEYVWSTSNGNIVSGGTTLTPTVDAGGIYSLQVTDTSNGCVISSDVTVTDDTDIPVAVAAFSGIVDCTTPTVVISGSGSSTGTEYTYVWTTIDGTIDSGANTLDPTVSSGGTYTLTILDTLSSCVQSTDVTVPEDTVIPTVDVGPDSVLDCATPTMTVDGSNSSSGTEFTYTWTTIDGNITGNTDGTSIEIDSGGVYLLTVANTVNGCVNSASVTIGQDFDIPQVSADPGGEINCVDLTIPLVGQVSGNTSNFVYNWQFFGNGSVSAGQGTLNAEASQADTYFLVVTDTVNSCTAIDSVLVTVDSDVPDIVIADLDTLSCSLNSIVIDATGSTQDNDIVFTWQTTNGQFDSGTNTLTPTISTAGSYELILNDTVNNCVTNSVFTIEQDTVQPVIALTSSSLINCFNNIIPIDASVNSSGSSVDAIWSAISGGVIDGSNTGLSINVSSAGTYQVLITDQSNGCTNTESVNVTADLDKPVLSSLEPDSITCPQPSVTLSANVDTQGDPYNFNWTTDSTGSLDSDTNTLSPTVSGAAPYTLSVQNTSNGCSDTLVINVFGDLDLPTVDAQVADFLSCSNVLVDIDGSGSSSTGTYQYTWSTTNGNIVSGQNTLLLQVDQPGDYLLQVEDLSNSCVNSTSVSVTQDLTAPVSSISLPDTLSCGTTEVSLFGDAGTNPSPTYQYSWTTTNGNISSGTSAIIASANQAGTYTLEIIDTFNGCISTSSVDVVQDIAVPVADAGTALTLDCNITSQVLDGSASSQGAIYTYQWTTSTGNIIAQATGLNPLIDAPGTYDLLVLNVQNQCTNTAQVTVDQQIDPPTVEAGDDDTINCIQSVVQLSGAGSSTGADYEYLWSSLDGNPIIGQTQLDASVDLEGVYQLLITNNINGCKDSDIVVVALDTITPVLSGEIPDQLTCAVSDVLLAVNSSVINNVSYTWTSTNGNIVSGAATANPLVDTPGIYDLQFVNVTNGCQAQEQIEVLQDIVEPTVDAGLGGTITCSELVFNAQGTAATNSGQTSISWSTTTGTIDSGGTTTTPIMSSDGIYIIEVTDLVNSCVSIDSLEVLIDQVYPVIEPLNSQTLDCNNLTVTIDASSTNLEPQYSLSWTTTNGNIVGGGTTLTPVVDLAGQYSLAIVDANNGCETSESVSILSDFVYPDISAGTDIDLPCGVSSTNLQGTVVGSTNDLQILWTAVDGSIIDGANTLNPTIGQGGTYSLSVQNTINGCESLDTVAVLFDAPPLLTLQSADPECAGNFGSLNITSVVGGTPPFVYSIDNGQNYSSSTDFSFLNAGDYSVIAQDANGCETEVSQVSITEPPVFDVIVVDSFIQYQQGQQAQIIADPSYPLSSISSIVWSPAAGLSCVDCLDPIVNTQVSTTYMLDLINASGCSTSISVTVIVDASANVFIANSFTPNADGINEVLMIQADITNIKEVKRFDVYDRWGELLFSQSNFQPNDPQYGWDGTYRGSVLNQGVYVYYVEVEMLDGRVELFKGDVFLGN
jgi:gliding motility-associated-like protein